ncbi:MAG: amino acid adenylation domain-containing protein, partial [Bacteroidales bacterium]|nr:amino acid adenylation domain-containing protein [Bacteroidales bacterium]
LSDEIKIEVSSQTSYAQYANWINKQNAEEVTNYWKELLSDSEATHIYGKEKKDNIKNENIVTFTTPLSHELSQHIEQIAKENKVSPNSVFECAFSIALQKFSGSEDVVFDKIISGRSIPLKNIENTVGLFINNVPVRIKSDENSTLADLLKETQNQTINANTHGILPLAEIYKTCDIDAKSIDALFVFENYFTGDASDIENGPLSPELISFDEQTEFNLTVTILKETNGYSIRTSYANEMYSEREIKSFINGYISVFSSSLTQTTLIKDISVLTVDEKETILNSFNSTSANYAKGSCIHELFEEQAERTPDKIALVAVDKKVTYKELNEEANRIANALIEQGIGKGDIVGLMLPRKSYLLSALFGILKTGAAYLPIDMELPQERIEYMCKDTNAKFVVSSDNIDALLNYDNSSNPNVELSNDSLCYCIYTSGSTGQPKGVMARHRNVVNYISKNEHNIFGKIVKDDFEAIVSISTCSFDIFVTETIATLVNGLRVVLADEQECRNQYALNRLLTREKGEFLQTTPTKLKVLTADPSQREFLKNVKAILLGGEAMEFSYLNELKKLTNAKIYNIYGVTEVPIWSAFVDTDTFTDTITIGHGIANTQMYVVDKHLKPVPIGVTGELCIAGDSVSQGYLNQPELTAEKFVDNPFGSGKLYKTGDHAYWREDGNLVYIGRKDFQVKIRGLRIELGEIESVLQAVDGIERAVVVVRKDKEDRQLLCAFYTGKEIDAKQLRTELGATLPKYMVPHIFTHLIKMPMTSSGKANRNALPEIDLTNISTEIEYVAPTTEKETILTNAIEKVLRIDKVSILDNFFDLGGDSLKSIELVSVIEDKGYTVNVKSIFEAKDIQSLANQLIEKTEKEETVEYSSVLPATAAQMRIYTAQMMKSDSTHYNVNYVFKAEDVNKEKLQKAINSLISRHESLRTHFENINGVINQVIDESATVIVDKLPSNPTDFIKPFDLSKSPLLRVGCNEDTAVIDIHHIIVDGESMPVFFKELNELYMGRELPTTVQYGEFAVTDSFTEDNEKYWLNVFSEEITTLDLPTDFTRPETQSFKGTNIYTRIDNKLNESIQEKCRQLGITPYAYYMACYNILLSKFSSNEDICVGVPTSGRNSKFLNTIGMFVNTIALRTNTDGNKTVNTLMQETRANSISAIDNQNYPFGELVKKLNIPASNRNPLYDVMFAYQSESMTDITFGDNKVELVPTTSASVKSELGFYVLPRKEDTILSVEYCTDLYKEQTINKFINAYMSILQQALTQT